jgi:hypothetical protein
MDLCFFMEDDLPNVKRLGTHLMEEMRNTTSDYKMGMCVCACLPACLPGCLPGRTDWPRFVDSLLLNSILHYFPEGFGAFVDKTQNSTTEGMLQNPCKRTEPWLCFLPFYMDILVI